MRIIIFVVIAFINGCSKNIDNAMNEQDLTAEFLKHKNEYKLLVEMINDDASSLKQFEVASDRLGKYRVYDGGWAKEYGKYVPIGSALEEYSLTEVRYQMYLDLLSGAEASVVERYGNSVSIAISATGFVFGGCLTKIHYSPDKLPLEKPSWAQIYYQVQYNENWGGETKCN